jgi:hypothetical protein
MNVHVGSRLGQVWAGKVSEKNASAYFARYDEAADPRQGDLQDAMNRFFWSHFKTPEWYCFSEVPENTMYNIACSIFDDGQLFADKAVQFLHYYQKVSTNDASDAVLFVGYFSELAIDDEITDAIGIFKANNRDTFMQLISNGNYVEIDLAEGIFTGQPQMGCVILNTQRGEGFKVCPSFAGSRNAESAFWKESFLKITEAADDYHHTKHYIQATKKFIRDKMPDVTEMDKTAEAAVMQRSFEYFKQEDNFDVDAYEVKVFKDREVVEAFRDFREAYSQEKPGMLADQFDISDSAVKKQSNVFKSVIKLDKNFHIYVHGDRNKIRKGTDDNGQKFYMIYYEDES